MAKCYFTGVDLPTQEMFVLDVTAARRAMRDLSSDLTRSNGLCSNCIRKMMPKYTTLENNNQSKLNNFDW